MIHVVTADNQHLYARQLDQMFRMRHDYYVLGHGWEGVAGHNGKEIDEFDDGGVVYLLAVDPFGDVAASLRLNPCSGPTLLGKLRSEYCPGADVALEDPAAWDLSRWIARPEDRRGTGKRWKTNFQRELMIGLLEFCERHGVSRLTMLAELRIAERIAAYGWPVRHLAEPRTYEGGKGVAVAAEIETGLHVMALTRARTGILNPVLVEVQPGVVPSTPHEQQHREVAEAAVEIGAGRLARLARAIGRAAASGATEETARAIEFVGVLNRLLESLGSGLEHIDEAAGLNHATPDLPRNGPDRDANRHSRSPGA